MLLKPCDLSSWGVRSVGCCAGGMVQSRSEALQRRAVLLGIGTLLATGLAKNQAHALPVETQGSLRAQNILEFNRSMAERDGNSMAQQYWTMAMSNGQSDQLTALVNRGYAYLRASRYEEARADLRVALTLAREEGKSYKDLLLQLGTAEGACGDWNRASRYFALAAYYPERRSAAMSKLALALFQLGNDEAAIAQVRTCLCNNPDCMDSMAALATILWVDGLPDKAAAAWQAVQDAQNGLGARLYGPTTVWTQVGGRWPPRAQAALHAMLTNSRVGQCVGQDGKVYNYVFDKAVIV